MGKFLKRRRLHIWIACFAILLNALAPSLSHALASMHGKANWGEICTAEGTKYVAPDGSVLAGSPMDSTLHHLEHCPFCMGDSGVPPVPVAPSAPFALTGGHDLFPSLYYHSPTPLFSWSQARPRGPPARA